MACYQQMYRFSHNRAAAATPPIVTPAIGPRGEWIPGVDPDDINLRVLPNRVLVVYGCLGSPRGGDDDSDSDSDEDENAGGGGGEEDYDYYRMAASRSYSRGEGGEGRLLDSRERPTGPFRRYFNLPAGVVVEKITAVHDKGVLEIVIPKVELLVKVASALQSPSDKARGSSK
jgi:hypothetical protein